MEAQFENLRSKLIVSCQALEDEPLHSSFIMGRMAKAAYEGGAAGIRADRKSTRLNSSHLEQSRMPSSA